MPRTRTGFEEVGRGRSAHGASSARVLSADRHHERLWMEEARALTQELLNLHVISLSENRGKPAALNAALRMATGEIVVTVDADTTLDTQAVNHLVARLTAENSAAVAANVRVGNRDGWLTRWQSVEYVTALNLDRRAQAALGFIITVPGATAAYRTASLRAAGGFSADTACEDTDLTLTFLARGERVSLEPRALSYTQAPETVVGLFRQRSRWLYGNLQCLWKHRHHAFSQQRPALGWLALPNLMLTHVGVYALMPLCLVLLWKLQALFGWKETLALMAVLYVLELATCVVAYVIERTDGRDLIHAPLQRLGMPTFLAVVLASIAIRRAVGGIPRWRPLEVDQSSTGRTS